MRPQSRRWLPLADGTTFDLDLPTPAMMQPDAIMHQLAMITRWGGNVRFPYSVLQHSLHVADAIREPSWKIYGLIHDWPEALLGADIITPVKRFLALDGTNIELHERWYLRGICRRLNIKYPHDDIEAAVKLADRRVLATEYRDVVKGRHPTWKPDAEPFEETIPEVPWQEVLDKAHFALADAMQYVEVRPS